MREVEEADVFDRKWRRGTKSEDRLLPWHTPCQSSSVNDVDLAREAIRELSPELETQFITVYDFLVDNPDFAPAISKIRLGEDSYPRKLALRFVKGRAERRPSVPSTVPDPVVSIVMEEYFGASVDELLRISGEHASSMGAENIVGDLLERYISHRLEEREWVWCSGSAVRSIDFVRRREDGSWESLQVKNRDNSENSSSSAIRNGTPIEKWYRTKSRTGETCWNIFPVDVPDDVAFGEMDFQRFVRDYLRRLLLKSS